jgi:general secretion pathway protein E
MSSNTSKEFEQFLWNKYHFVPRIGPVTGIASENTLRNLWQSTDLTADDFAGEVAGYYGLQRAGLAQLLAGSPLLRRFSARFLRETTIFPYEAPDGQMRLAVADPADLASVRAAEIVLGGAVVLEVASFEDISTALNERLGSEDSAPAETAQVELPHSDDDIESLRDLASGAPVVRAVNDLLEKAIEARASDVHIEPSRNGLIVRLRVDGVLRPLRVPAGVPPQAMISRVKILSGLNIAERRLPQDGAARLRVANAELDVRVATMPTQHGEAAVIRLLPKDRGLLDIGRLGLLRNDKEKLERLLALPHGMIIITGPTGSGKTTTLATMLSILNEPTRKILTIEDPVEYEIEGVNQSQVKPAIGLSFATALRSFVRQDPDVIMVGEVRDSETAHIAIHAALTGHLVLTTLHTETAAAAVPHMLDLKVESFLLRSTLRAVIAQRLVRVLCDRCKIQRKLTGADLAADPRYNALGLKSGEVVSEPSGCEHCSGSGYRGRSGVFEILEITHELRNLISANADGVTIDEAAIRSGMTTMIDDAVAKCRAGVTSAAEVLRVTTLR